MQSQGRKKLALTKSNNEENQINKASMLPIATDLLRNSLFKYCDSSDAANLARTCKQFYNIDKYRHAVFLEFVVAGDMDRVKRIIQRHHRFILLQGPVTEWCGRRWINVSPLEYAAWAGDTFMVKMLLEFIPFEEKHKALQQLKNMKENGTEHGKHLSAITMLSEAYRTFFRNYSNRDRDDRYYHPNPTPATLAFWNDWRTQVGGAQRQLPFSLLQYFLTEYKSLPAEFSKPPYPWSDRIGLRGLGITYALHARNRPSGEIHHWRHRLPTYNGISSQCARAEYPGSKSNFDDDSHLVDYFREIRTQDLAKQTAELEELLAPAAPHKSWCLVM